MKFKKIFKIKIILNKIPYISFFYLIYKEFKSRKILSNSLKKNIVKIELGSGIKKGVNGWTTIDLYGADVNLDLRKKLPIPNLSVDEFFASHFLEHLGILELQIFLLKCFQQLKLGGKFLIAVPDASLFIHAYNKNENIIKKFDTVHEKSYIDTKSSIDQLNYIAYMSGEHKHMFDSESLVNLFLSVGFRECNPRPFINGFDTEEHRQYSIYFVAIK